MKDATKWCYLYIYIFDIHINDIIMVKMALIESYKKKKFKIALKFLCFAFEPL